MQHLQRVILCSHLVLFLPGALIARLFIPGLLLAEVIITAFFTLTSAAETHPYAAKMSHDMQMLVPLGHNYDTAWKLCNLQSCIAYPDNFVQSRKLCDADCVSLDNLWALDLNKLDGWRCIKESTTGDVKESLDSDNSSSGSNSDKDSA